jgi:hypothetical protein
MRLALCLAIGLVLSGCDDSTSSRDSGGPLRTEQEAAKTEPTPDPAKAGELPSQGIGPRFIGRWATDPGSCKADPWLFTDTSLHTPAGSTCSFNRVTEVQGGYDIQATCSAEAPPTSDTLEIRFDEAAKTMLFQSETVAGGSLVFCGRTA